MALGDIQQQRYLSMTTLELTGPAARQAAHRYVDAAPDGYFVRITDATRTLEQNALLWPLLTKISNGVDWYGQKLTKEEWKDVLTASLKAQKAVPGIDGGFVVCGLSTSNMGKKLFSDLIEVIYAFAASKGVEL